MSAGGYQPKCSVIAPDGRYQPGTQGNTERRHIQANQLFTRRPTLQQKIEADPSSHKFNQIRLLGFDDRLTDGFRARFSREILVLDARVDTHLKEHFLPFLSEYLKRVAKKEPGVATQIKAASMVVADALGGVRKPDQVQSHWAKTMDDLDSMPEHPKDIWLGYLVGKFMHTKNPAGSPGYVMEEEGCGVCRHRTLLMKYVCDNLGIARCAAVDGIVARNGTADVDGIRKKCQGGDHMWNLVRVDGRTYIVDCMSKPGQLLDADDVREATGYSYHRVGGHDGRSLAVRPTKAGEMFAQVHEMQWGAELEAMMEGDSAKEDDESEQEEDAQEKLEYCHARSRKGDDTSLVVWSNHLKDWMPCVAVKPIRSEHTTVEFWVDGAHYRKTVPRGSELLQSSSRINSNKCAA